MSVRAKFYCGGLNKFTQPVYEKDENGALIKGENGRYKEKQIETANITLYPVVEMDPKTENGKFFASTPGGKLELYTVNPDAWKQFEVGKSYYLDITPAE